jgi:SAM-dependent methyltransferase
LCCGVGRHSIELARRGFHVTGVDITARYLDEARRQAKRAKVNVDFIRSDMRRFRRNKSFDVVLNFFTSFGFFKNQNDDRRVIQNIYSSLKKGGVFLMELMGKEILARIYQKRDWIERDGLIILEEREPLENWSYIKARWILIKRGHKKEYTVKLRLYSAVELTTLLKAAGFRKLDVYGVFTGVPYDHTAKRLVVRARK